MADEPQPMGQNELIGQNEIEELLRQSKAGAGGAGSAPASASSSSPAPSAADPKGKPASPTAAPADESRVLSQGEIEALLAQKSHKPAAPKPARSQAAPAAGPSLEPAIAPKDIEFLLHKAEEALASLDGSGREVPPGVAPFRLEDFSGAPPSSEAATLELIRDVELDVEIELGRTQMHLEDVLKLRKGAVVPLDKLAGDPVDIYVNGRLIARGEVLVLNDNFCVRVAELVTAESVAG